MLPVSPSDLLKAASVAQPTSNSAARAEGGTASSYSVFDSSGWTVSTGGGLQVASSFSWLALAALVLGVIAWRRHG